VTYFLPTYVDRGISAYYADTNLQTKNALCYVFSDVSNYGAYNRSSNILTSWQEQQQQHQSALPVSWKHQQQENIAESSVVQLPDTLEASRYGHGRSIGSKGW
jgi:hypothetical protein